MIFGKLTVGCQEGVCVSVCVCVCVCVHVSESEREGESTVKTQHNISQDLVL